MTELKTTKEELNRYSKIAKNYRKLKQTNLIHDARHAHILEERINKAGKSIEESVELGDLGLFAADELMDILSGRE